MTEVVLHGGGGSKVSLKYEEEWTRYVLLDLLVGPATRLTLEPPGTMGHGFEFVLEFADRSEWHQVKYQNASLGKWTLAALKDEDVLEHFRAKLVAAARNECVFVSAHDPFPLSRLAAGARHSDNHRDFEGTYLSSELLRNAFRDLAEDHWASSRPRTWEWLKNRVRTRTIDRQLLRDSVGERIRARISGDPNAVQAALSDLVDEFTYKSITRTDVCDHLVRKGLGVRIWNDASGTIRAAVEGTSSLFREHTLSAQPLVGLIARGATSDLRRILGRADAPAVVLVVGPKGVGKSVVMLDAIDWATENHLQHLTVDVQRLSGEVSSQEIGAALQLPDAPAPTLAGLVGGGRGLMLIDALDGASLNRDKPVALFHAIRGVISEARAFGSITLVISCRSEDLANDERLRTLTDDDSVEWIVLDRLELNEVTALLHLARADPDRLSPEQMELLRSPICLKYYLDSLPAGEPTFSSESDLAGRFLDYRAQVSP